MQPSWLSILPPLVVLITAFITKKLHLSLIVAIIAAAFIATSGSPFESTTLMGKRLWNKISDLETIYLFAFLLVIGSLIMLICKTGGIYAFGNIIKKKLKTKKGVESASLVLSIIVGIDDYLNSLTVGHVMQPIIARYGISRTKLAYLVHSFASPLIIIIPITSWVAMITSNLDSSGVSLAHVASTKILADPFFVYLKSVPFIFYSLFTLFTVWFITHRQYSYGPMYYDEQEALKKAAQHQKETPEQSDKYSLWDIIIPLGTLVVSVIVGILYTGNYYLFGGNNNLIGALKNNTQSALVLLVSGIVAFVLSFTIALIQRKVHFDNLPKIVKDGTLLMIPSILMLTFASTLGSIMEYDLGTGTYLAQTFTGYLSVMLFPFIFFIMSSVTALMTGSSWGTITLILPIGIPMLLSILGIETPATVGAIPMLFPVLGAIFSGAVSGDHLSPISETTIMASTSSGADPIAHATTQLPYGIPAFTASAIGFLISGMTIGLPIWQNLIASIGSGLLVCVFLLFIFNKCWKP